MSDPLWPPAATWLARSDPDPRLTVTGVPTSVASISPSDGWRTPAAFRELLGRFSMFDGEGRIDLGDLAVADLGDLAISGLGMEAAQQAIHDHAAGLEAGPVRTFIGGDNSITRPLVGGLFPDLDRVGVLTLDAHHDVRSLDEGPRNGTPIRGLIEDGLPGRNVAQVGIHSFANSLAYRRWCEEHGITVVTMRDIDTAGIEPVLDDVVAELLERADALYVDVDMDVLDRAFAPACPGARPGGLTPRQLATAVSWLGRHPSVAAADFVEVDAGADRDDVTMMALASTFLSFAAGVARRIEEA